MTPITTSTRRDDYVVRACVCKQEPLTRQYNQTHSDNADLKTVQITGSMSGAVISQILKLYIPGGLPVKVPIIVVRQ